MDQWSNSTIQKLHTFTGHQQPQKWPSVSWLPTAPPSIPPPQKLEGHDGVSSKPQTCSKTLHRNSHSCSKTTPPEMYKSSKELVFGGGGHLCSQKLPIFGGLKYWEPGSSNQQHMLGKVPEPLTCLPAGLQCGGRQESGLEKNKDLLLRTGPDCDFHGPCPP